MQHYDMLIYLCKNMLRQRFALNRLQNWMRHGLSRYQIVVARFQTNIIKKPK